MREQLPLRALPAFKVGNDRLGDALAVVIRANFSEGRPIDGTAVKGVKQHVARFAEAGIKAPCRVGNHSPIAALSDAAKHPIDDLCFARARGAGDEEVLGFQHARDGHASDGHVCIVAGLAVRRAGVQFVGLYHARTSAHGFIPCPASCPAKSQAGEHGKPNVLREHAIDQQGNDA